jgi:hypothetical protein
MRESKIEAYLRRRVTDTGGNIRKVKWLDRRGAPDRLCWWPYEGKRRDAFVETKPTGGEPEPHQVREHERLRKAGFRVFVIDSLEGVDEFVREVSR